jgi:hypothetical protein
MALGIVLSPSGRASSSTLLWFSAERKAKPGREVQRAGYRTAVSFVKDIIDNLASNRQK